MIGLWGFRVFDEIVSIASRASDPGRHRKRDVRHFQQMLIMNSANIMQCRLALSRQTQRGLHSS